MEPDRSDATLQSDEMSRSNEMSMSSSLLGWRSSLSWGASLTLGVITLILGVVLAAQPAASLAVIAILAGVVMIVSGIYHIVRAVDNRERDHRVWRGIAGVLFILAGLVLLRNLHLSLALIGLFVGFTWIIQGVMLLVEGFSRDRTRAQNGWTIFFGILSLIAGIVVVVAPIASLFALTIFLGVWFVVLGAMEICGSFIDRRAARKIQAVAAEAVSVPQQRAGTAEVVGQSTAGQGVTDQGTVDQGTMGQSTAGQAAPGGTAGQGTPGGSRPTSRRHWHIPH